MLNALNESDWKDSKVSPTKIEKFLDRHLEILANHKDVNLQHQLIQLNDRINATWDNHDAQKLSFEIMGIAKSMDIAKSILPNVNVTELPPDMWEEILSHIPPRGEIHDQPGRVRSGLENIHLTSKGLSHVAKTVEKKWLREEAISPKKFGCNTADEAITYIIENKLKTANLLDFPDLKQDQLEQLMISSPDIKTLPSIASKSKLRTLTFFQCRQLEKLPAIPSLQSLECNSCSSLETLPEYPNLQTLKCIGIEVKGLPKYPLLQTLECDGCMNLESLPELNQLQTLKIHFCNQLPNLPKFSQLQTLNIKNCHRLPNLPEFPQLLTLKIDNCSELQNVPKYPLLKMFECEFCENLQNFPKFPQLQALIIAKCPRIQNFPEYPKLQTLSILSCENLQSLPEATQLQKLECEGCENVQNLPEFPQLQMLKLWACGISKDRLPERLQNLPTWQR